MGLGRPASRYDSFLASLQRFRGRIYLADGAIRKSHLDADGRHRLEADWHSWHLVALDERDEICGCSRYTIHPRNRSFSDLGVSRSTLAKSGVWQSRVVHAVEQLRDLAHERGVDFVEVGGWAISEDLRRSAESLRVALGTYALASILGGCIGITTATVRHHSASVLRKIGGSGISSGGEELPTYFDCDYNCEMQLLKFNHAEPNPQMAEWIVQLRNELRTVQVIRPSEQGIHQPGIVHTLGDCSSTGYGVHAGVGC